MRLERIHSGARKEKYVEGVGCRVLERPGSGNDPNNVELLRVVYI